MWVVYQISKIEAQAFGSPVATIEIPIYHTFVEDALQGI